MADENGANFCGIKEVFGLDIMMYKVVSYQIHLKLCQ